jgi:uncharacterized membrane protein YraQ (UPF0718 family)
MDTNKQLESPFVVYHEPHQHLGNAEKKSRLSFYVQLSFVLTVAALIFFYRENKTFGTLGITFVSIFLEALPFMLMGSLIGGLIEIFVSKESLARILPKTSIKSIFIAAGVGLIFPVCECAIVPVVKRLFQKGLPLGAGISFLLGGPIVNPLVVLSTAVAYGYDWSMAINRLLIGYLIAVTIGFLVELFFNKRKALTQQALDSPAQCSCGHDHCCGQSHAPQGTVKKIIHAMQHAADDFLDIGRYLVFGAFIAACLQSVISRGDLAIVADSPIVSILAMMLLAIILNLCSEADAFVAASFRTTIPLTAQLAFMVLGPMLDIKLVLMYFRIFRKRLILVLSCMTFLIVFLSMVVSLWSHG